MAKRSSAKKSAAKRRPAKRTVARKRTTAKKSTAKPRARRRGPRLARRPPPRRRRLGSRPLSGGRPRSLPPRRPLHGGKPAARKKSAAKKSTAKRRTAKKSAARKYSGQRTGAAQEVRCQEEHREVGARPRRRRPARGPAPRSAELRCLDHGKGPSGAPFPFQLPPGARARRPREPRMSATTAYSSPRRARPSVLVVLAVRDAAEWLRECLQALAVQTYLVSASSRSTTPPPTARTSCSSRRSARAGCCGTTAVWDSLAPSTRPSRIRSPRRRTSSCCCMTTRSWILKPSTRLVEATMLCRRRARRDRRREDRRLGSPSAARDAGRSADLFGHPYSALQAEEIDQGQSRPSPRGLVRSTAMRDARRSGRLADEWALRRTAR